MQQLNGVTESLLDEVIQASYKLAEHLPSVKYKDEVDSKIKKIASLSFIRCIRTFDAFTVLVKAGYALEAEVLNRMLLETVVDWLFLCNSPVERVERYEDYLKAWRCKPLAWQNALETECGHKPVSIPKDVKKEIKKAKEEFCNKYYGKKNKKLPDSWSQENMRDKAKEVDLLSVYLTAHKRQSQYVHGGPLSHKHYMSVTQQGPIIFKTQPDWENIEPTVGLGCLLMGSCLDAANISLELSCDELLEGIREKIRNYTASK